MANLALTNDEVYSHLGYFLGISRVSSDWDPQTLADVQRIVRSGKRKFFGANNWHFLEQEIAITLQPPQETGTITIVDGVVTLVGSTWPADVVDNYVLVPDGGGAYKVAVRTSSTVVSLHDTSVDAAALTTYKLYKVNYDLPATFGGWLDPITRANTDYCVKELATLPEWEVRGIASSRQVRTGAPELFSVSQRMADQTNDAGIPEWFLSVYPLPDNVYVLFSRIRVQPGDALDMENDVPVSSSIFAECLLEAILAAAETLGHDSRGVHNERFIEILADAVRKDNSLRGTRSLKPREPATTNPIYYLQTAPVTYNTI